MDGTEPVAGITGITGITRVAGDSSRPPNSSSSQKQSQHGGKDKDDTKKSAATPVPAAPPVDKRDVDADLIEVLDRLRATGALQPVEAELSRHIRGARYYQEESRHALPILPEIVEDVAASPPRLPDAQADPPQP